MVVLGFLGLGIASVLTQHFYEFREGLHGFRSACSFGAQMDCDAVASSRYAEVLPGVPVAALAMGWFVAWCVVGMVGFYESLQKQAKQMLAGLCLLGTLVCLAYFFVMVVWIRAYCLGCLCIDFIHLLGLGASWKWISSDLLQRKCLLGWAGVMGCVAFALVLARFLVSSDTSHWAEEVLSMPVVSVPVHPSSLSFGSDQAPITVVEFSDFQCSACQKAAFLFHAVKKRYRDKLRFVFKNYPLDRSCNPSLPQTIHPAACEAALLAFCAHSQKKFEEVYETLFNFQQQFVSGKLFSLLEGKGMTACSSAEWMPFLEKDIQEAESLGVKATPTFFINGHKMEGIYPVSVWNEMIDRLLASLP